MQCATMSSGRVRLNVPLNDLASPVLTLSTMTTSRILFSIMKLKKMGIVPISNGGHKRQRIQGVELFLLATRG